MRKLRAAAGVAAVTFIAAGLVGCGSSTITHKAAAQTDAGIRACVAPGATSTAAGVAPDPAAEKACLERDAKETTEPARRKADESEIAKGAREVQQGQAVAGQVEHKAEAEAAPAWSPQRPDRSTSYTEQEMRPAGAVGVLPVDRATLGRLLHGDNQLAVCVTNHLGVNDASHMIALLIALHTHEAAAEKSVEAGVHACR